MCIFISPEAASQKNKQTKNKDKYIAREIYNTQFQYRHYAYIMAIGMIRQKTELFQWLRMYVQ